MPHGDSSSDLFGSTPVAELATPGSYGIAPPSFRLPTAARLGTAHLQVADLGRSIAFYVDLLGLREIDRQATRAALGAQGSGRILIELQERSGARPVGRGARLGLFHVAILLPDRAALGRFLAHMRERGVPLGAGDHLVSEALYLSDPDGLGLEIYADRPRTSWHRLGRELMLATDAVDLSGLLLSGAGAPWTGMPAHTTIGHVHLHVGDLARASTFFSDALGFDRMTWRYPGALFLGAGGYHHHLGANTWAGPGATPPGEGDAKLLAWTIELPDEEDVSSAAASLLAGDFTAEPREGGAVHTRDPWGTAVHLKPTATR